MRIATTFQLELIFNYTPAEWERGHLFHPERMELQDSNLELSDQQIDRFAQMALEEFKTQQAEDSALRAYELNLER